MGAAALLLTACSNDNDLMPAGRDGYVTFTAELPSGFATRAFADGSSAIHLRYGVYNEAGTKLLNEGSATFENKQAKVEIPMITGATYQLVFWADSFGGSATDSPYGLDLESGVMTVDYTKVTTNDDALDAFFCVKQDFTATANMPAQTATLTRPFAQVNIATADLAQAKEAGINPQNSVVTVIPAYTELNLLNGAASEPTDVAVTYSAGNIAAGETVTVNNTVYDNLAMVYVLAAETSELFQSVGMTLSSKTTTDATAAMQKSYPNVPYKRNFRTNIVGNLLTSNSDWNVIIDNEFGGSLWTGDSKDPTADEEGVYHIKTAADLAGLAKMVNAGDNFSGKTVVLDNDIDLNNQLWTPIGLNADVAAKKFQGTFDGHGHTISNLRVVTPTAYTAAGFFGALNGTAKNFTIDGAYVEHISDGGSSGLTDNGVAVVAGSIYNFGTISGVTVNNATVKGNRYTAGIAGYVYGNITDCTVTNSDIVCTPDNLTGSWDNGDKCGGIGGYIAEQHGVLTGNTVTGCHITAYRDAGGLLGCYNQNAPGKVKDNRVANTTVKVNNTQNYKNYTTNAQYNVKELIGRTSTTLDATNTATDVTLNLPF